MQKVRHAQAKREMYEKFSDGWDFSPDVGNSYSRGEVFTPKHVVDMMISDSGMFSDDAIYDGDYSSLDDDETRKAVNFTVLESAVGTGNFLSEVMWHKMSYANALAKRNPSVPYDSLVAEAVASVYANDIDCGNLQVAKSRVLFGDTINYDTNLNFWVSQYSTNADGDHPVEEAKADLRASLTAADERWGSWLNGEGVVSKLYAEHSGKPLTEQFEALLRGIADSNFILFDSIVCETVGSVPGWRKVSWQVHEIDSHEATTVVSSEPLSFALQLGLAELETLTGVRATQVQSGATERALRNTDKKLSTLREHLKTLPGHQHLIH